MVAGLHYIVINLAASLLFLIGVSLIFGVTGTLNMAVLAEQVATLPAQTRSLFQVGAAILGVAFLVKAAAWPLGFWLPRTYDAAVPAAAAMFAIMTKVGVYAIMRLGLLCFSAGAAASAGFGDLWLFLAGATTIIVGIAGMLAAGTLAASPATASSSRRASCSRRSCSATLRFSPARCSTWSSPP